MVLPLKSTVTRVCLILLSLTVTACLTALEAAEPKLHALLIGVKEYEAAQLNKPPLKFPEEDAKAIGDRLSQSGYEVTLLLGEYATKEAIQNKLAELGQRGNAEGAVVVGLFGHGVEFDSSYEAMFCPYDTALRAASDRDGKAVYDDSGVRLTEPDPQTLVSMAEVLTSLRLCKAGNKLLLADCCRVRPNAARGRAFGETFNKKSLPDKTICLFACSAGEQAYEHPDWGHGAMTKAFLENFATLESADSDVTEIIVPMRRSVKSMVRAITNGREEQTLHDITNGGVDLKLKPNRLIEYLEKNGYLEFAQYLPGRPAPPLNMKFYIGDPVTRFERGKIYVLHFSCTSCPPEYGLLGNNEMLGLPKRFPEAIFIEVLEHNRYETADSTNDVESLLRNSGAYTTLFEKSSSEKTARSAKEQWRNEIGYRFCVNPNATWAHEGWPFVLIVNQDGNIAWHGNPLDEKNDVPTMLQSITKGTWNIPQWSRKEILDKGLTVFGSKNYSLSLAEKDPTLALQNCDSLMLHCDSREELMRAKAIKIVIMSEKSEPLNIISQLEDYVQEFATGNYVEIPEHLGVTATALRLHQTDQSPRLRQVLQGLAKSFPMVTDAKMWWQIEQQAELELNLGNNDKAIALLEKAIGMLEELAASQGGDASQNSKSSQEELREKIQKIKSGTQK